MGGFDEEIVKPQILGEAVVAALDAFRRFLENRFHLGEVDFLHLHHGLHGALAAGFVGAADEIGHGAGDDLPGEAKLVLEPAALAFLAAVGDQSVPVAVDLGLIIGGGTAQIQKNIIAERGLGMPREPRLAS